jgi:type II secretory pathway component PulF
MFPQEIILRDLHTHALTHLIGDESHNSLISIKITPNLMKQAGRITNNDNSIHINPTILIFFSIFKFYFFLYTVIPDLAFLAT